MPKVVAILDLIMQRTGMLPIGELKGEGWRHWGLVSAMSIQSDHAAT